MLKRKVITLSLFFLLIWLTIMLFNVWVHEMGHAITFAVTKQWRHTLVYFGSALPIDHTLLIAATDWLLDKGLTPDTYELVHQVERLVYLGENVDAFRWGVIGGWLGQLVCTGLVLLLTRTRAFKSGASAYSRLFWHGYALINLAWMGGNWFLQGLQEPISSDPVILIKVILHDNPVAVGLLWVVALGTIFVAWQLAKVLVGQLFTAFGFTAVESQQLAKMWVIATALAGVSLRIPQTTAAAGVALLVVLILPFWMLNRLLQTREASQIQVPGNLWQGMGLMLGLMLLMIFTNSGIFVLGQNADKSQNQAIYAYYCEQTECLPPDVAVWLEE